MESLKEFFKNIWAKIVVVLKRFENSTFFEQIMRRYESLTPTEQTNVRKVLSFILFCFFAFLVLGGPLMILSKVKKIKALEKLEADAFIFQAEYESKNKGYTPPSGWTPVSAGSPSDLSYSFNEYLLKMGVPEMYGTLVSNGLDLNLTLREISLRQATKILFQLEAFYPKLKTTYFSARPNSLKPDVLDIEARFEFNTAAGGQFAQDTSNSQNYPDEEGGNSPGRSEKTTPGESFSGGRRDDNFGDNSNVSGGYVPPPPGGENFDEYVPPEMPDDIPPPPPPPGFEGGGDSE